MKLIRWSFFCCVLAGGSWELLADGTNPVPPLAVKMPPGAVAWWRAADDAEDSIGQNNGVLEGGLKFGPGKVGKAFLFDNPQQAVRVPAGKSLDVGAGEGFTIEGWINPVDVAGRYPIVEWNNGKWYGVQFYIDPVFSTGTRPGTLYANIIGQNGTWHQIWSGDTPIVTNSFQHVAVTYDKASGVAVLYCNARVVARENIGVVTPLTSYPLYLGRGSPVIGSYRFFGGLIDEISLYNRALASSEIQAIYDAGASGKIPPSVSLPSGAVAWWRADGTADDAVGNHHGALEGGAGYSRGETGSAFDFDGRKGYMEVPGANIWAFGTNDFTIELWASLRSVHESHSMLRPGVVFIGDGDRNGRESQWYYGVADGKLGLFVDDSQSGPEFLVQAPFTPDTNRWYHMAMVRAGSTFTTYVNGVATGSDSSSRAVPDVHAPLTIGHVEGPGFTDGILDELTIYRRALSAAELRAIYNAGSMGKNP